MQSEATTENQSFFDAENIDSKILSNESVSLEPPVANTTSLESPVANTTSLESPVANTTSLESPVANTTSLESPVANTTSLEPPVANLTNHFAAQVFIHKNFVGNNTIITQNTPLINGQFQDSISSLIITIDGNQSAGYMVEVCEHKSYAGNCMILGAGKHNIQTLGWLNDQISSLRVLSPETLELKNIKPGIITNGSN
ncbi:beta/gamma crystallin-related protein [Candidatus Nitrosocosmicus sp. SS]|nr:beta/gamma crystallin-related protein [Candidatus Nitrosocosmicus sp. SS]KAA2283211.1 hypothetical protein F1Z66_03795 [Candidatus Nitrosocosmicus sp. SS]KAF0868667.1 hypothetical protein E5N71_09825 [Candidatus Nitrosocosmicus sp. SS]